MMNQTRSSAPHRIRAVTLCLAVLAVSLAAAQPGVAAGRAAGAPGVALSTPEVVTLDGDTEVVEVNGRGWGHGIGLGQWGSLGYATEHGWTYTQILDHFYGGTTMGSVPWDSAITVRLVAHDGVPTHLYLQEGQMIITDLAGNPIPQQAPAIRFRRVAPNTFEVADAPSCAGPWTVRSGTVVTSTIRVNPSIPNGTVAQSLGVCLGGDDVRYYRGELRAVADPEGIQRTVNAVSLESYLRGVVPRESPALWGESGGGSGMHALRAQAVAARTYAVAENRYSYAKTCDTASCQVYGGMAVRQGGSLNVLEHVYTDQAVAETAGQVRLKPDGSIAYAMFSASTGGYTAYSSSTGFPAVPDLGDSVSPRHTWKTSISRAAIEAKYNLGSLQSIAILSRNGLGADGGRVTSLKLTFSNGTIERTGNQFRQDFGLYSDWFTPGGAVNAVASSDIFSLACPTTGPGSLQRLYTAYFLRGPDAGGWHHWTLSIVSGQSLTSISDYFSGSPEFIARYGSLNNADYVELVYLNVLARGSDAAGKAYWVGLLDSRRQSRGSVMLNFSNSDEYRAKTGNCP